MSLNCVNFDFRECSFNDEKLNIKDKKGDSRDGSGRAVMFRETDSNPLTYTFEANYCTGLRTNSLSSRWDMASQKKIVKEDSVIHDTSSNFYRGRKVPIYTPEVYFDVGKSLLIALLDYDCLNPVSRLLKKKDETLEAAIEKIRQDLKKSDEKPSIGQIKKKLGVGKKKGGPKFESKLDQFELVTKEESSDIKAKMEEMKLEDKPKSDKSD